MTTRDEIIDKIGELEDMRARISTAINIADYERVETYALSREIELLRWVLE